MAKALAAATTRFADKPSETFFFLLTGGVTAGATGGATTGAVGVRGNAGTAMFHDFRSSAAALALTRRQRET
jgi:hypothetical protein